VDELIKRNPNHRDAVLSGVGIALRFGLNDQAERYLSNWLAKHPNDLSVKKALDELRSKGGAMEGGTSGADSAKPVTRGN
jgi:hypothetical protein